MADDWEFLKPWHAVLMEIWTEQKIDDIESAKQVEFTWPTNSSISCMQKMYTLRFCVDKASRRDVRQLQQIREAMELFSILSFVNNKAFRTMFPSPPRKGITYPVWNLWLCGTLSPNDPAACRSPVTWGTLLGFPDNLRSYSCEYKAAIRKMKLMGIEDEGRKYVCNEFNIHLTYGNRYEVCGYNSQVEGTFELDGSSSDSKWFDGGLRNLFETNIDPMIQLCLTRGGGKVDQIWQDSHADHIPMSIRSQSVDVVVNVLYLTQAVSIPEMTAALARTPASSLYLTFDESDHNDIPTSGSHRQSIIDQGFLLSSLLYGRSLCEGTGAIGKYPAIPNRVMHEHFTLSCQEVSEISLAAICSVIGHLKSTHILRLRMLSVGPGTWPWLAYTLCCGTSVSISLTFYGATLMNSDIKAIADVLKFCYPKPSTRHSPEYGFVTFREGTEVWPSGLTEDTDCPLVMSSECRCRALFGVDDGVEAVIPGYGICKARLSKGISRDLKCVDFRRNLMCRSLDLSVDRLECVTLMVDLFALIGGNLRYLDVTNNTLLSSKDTCLNLTALSAVCPRLEELVTLRFDLVVSDQNESLRAWPLKRLHIDGTNKLSGIVECLGNPTLRMTRELLEVRLNRREAYDEVELRELESHHEEFLPVTKEKCPIELKTAMINVGINAEHGKAIRRLDSNILSLIFVFASTPAQRVVCRW